LKELREKFTIEGEAKPGGDFEIVAISAGEGNGWNFAEDPLKESLSLWDGAECFIDHDWFSRSIRDLAGVCHSPEWDEAIQGVKLKLKATGPAGTLLSELGKEMLKGEEKKPKVGFSADILFTAKGKDVQKILRVFSVDLVYNPARGGAFLRALNQAGYLAQHKRPNYQQEVKTVEEERTNLNEVQKDQEPAEQLSNVEADRQAVRVLLEEQARQTALAEEAGKARQVRAEMCGYLLTSALAASMLPAPAAERVRKQYAGKVFEPQELQASIDDARNLVSELTGGFVVQGPGRVQGMWNTNDQLQAAVHDLFGVPREDNAKGADVHKLSGIRELYMMLTGDYDLHGGYHPERVHLADTTDFTGLVKNALNKIVVNTWDQLGKAGYDWWERISTVEHFNTLNAITGTLVGTVGALPTVAEGAAYTELVVGDSPETATFTKYGGYIPLTLELIDRDETRKLKAYPRELAAAGLRKISALVAALFTAQTGVGPDLADGGALFNATAVTTAGGHKNLLTTALSATEWETVSAAVYDQPLLISNEAGTIGTGPKMAINPKYLLVPRALQLSAMKILYPTLENAANIYSENQQRGAPGDVVTVPEWTDVTDWAAVCDPRLAPAIYVGERFGLLPEIFVAGSEHSPAVFTNDEHRLKVRHFLAVWVNDFRPLHKSNVADA
jgi:hypothetical protein